MLLLFFFSSAVIAVLLLSQSSLLLHVGRVSQNCVLVNPYLDIVCDLNSDDAIRHFNDFTVYSLLS